MPVILDALVKHYDRLADDPESGIAPLGFSRQNIGFAVVLNPDGSLHGIEPRVDESSGKPRPINRVVPGQSKPPGQGLNPCLLWDNPTYLLGYAPNDRDPEWAAKRFESFRDRHLALADHIDDAGFAAVCKFLEAWSPAALADRSDTDPLTRPGFGVFQLRTENRYVHEAPEIQAYWLRQVAAGSSGEGASAMCLVTGESGPIARLHEPKIKRVAGAQSMGATLVSFNETAYDSFGKSQGDNAPVSQRAAFAYTTALNALLDDDKHRVQLGDTTCVFWADAPGSEAPDAVAEAMGVYPGFAIPEADGEPTRSALSDFLARFRQGKAGADTQALAQPDANFYILGLAPNAARISVRFWHQCRITELADRLQSHGEALDIIPDRPDQRPPTVWQLLRETARESKDIPPLLGGAYARAVLLDLDYPAAMITAVLRRIVADRTMNHCRAAILKAWLIRNHKQEITVALDTHRTDPAYLLGRLFAAYEKVQRDALGDKLNRTIRDSYLASASATPAGIFPRLYRLSQHHMSNLRRDKPGLAVVRERLIGEICDKLDTFPHRLSLPEQGLFAIGYYHQTQHFYKKPADESSEAQPETLTHA